MKYFYHWLILEDALYYGLTPEDIGTSPTTTMPFSQEDLNSLLDACMLDPNELHRRRDKAILDLLMDTGITVGELCSLTRQDFRHEEVTVGRRRRYIGEACEISIVKYFAKRILFDDSFMDDAPLFLSDREDAITDVDVLNLLSRLGESAGVGEVNPLRFRRTLAAIPLHYGDNFLQLLNMLGYQSLPDNIFELLEHLNRTSNVMREDHSRASPADRLAR